MQFYYGHQMPLRVLDEAEFWKHQEEEHTTQSITYMKHAANSRDCLYGVVTGFFAYVGSTRFAFLILL